VTDIELVHLKGNCLFGLFISATTIKSIFEIELKAIELDPTGVEAEVVKEETQDRNHMAGRIRYYCMHDNILSIYFIN
jgi:hypothetical protein